MTENHPITPPPELVKQWREAPEFSALSPCVMVTVTNTKLQDIATQAARWGADQELEACCEWLKGTAHIGIDFELLHARRPQPPSLKEQALIHFESFAATFETSGGDSDLIRRALEQLPE
jgi:hypothetical protein